MTLHSPSTIFLSTNPSLPASPRGIFYRIFIKESLGEYGSGWGWDSTWPYVFDNEYTTSNNNQIYTTPTKYINSINISKPQIDNITWVNYGTGGSSKARTDHCLLEITSGDMLFSGSNMRLQQSCEPHSYNAGNYYNYPAAALDNSELNSVCPKGWILPDNNGKTSFSNFLINYGIDHNATKTDKTCDAALLNLPLSYLRSGYYFSNGTLGDQGSGGYYRMTSQVLSFYSGSLAPTNVTGTYYGFSVRCVGR